MLAHPYKVTSWSGQLSGGQPDHERYLAGINFVVKRNKQSAFEVFNELVAMNLGRFLGLPIPIGFVIERKKEGHTFYCSSDVSIAGGEFPPAHFDVLAKNRPELFCGIAVFDAWICNHDRNKKNLFYDDSRDIVFLIDHGMGLLNNHGIDHMRNAKSDLSVHGDFARELSDFSSFQHWVEKINSMPDYVLSETALDAASVGIEKEVVRELVELLISRRTDLPGLFANNSDQFPKYNPDLFSPFEK